MMLEAVIMSGTMRPAASRKVGAKALRLTSLLLTRPEALIPSGQRMAKGTREPSSCRLAFALGKGIP